MSGYRRLNLDKLNFSKKTVSFEEATKDVKPISFPTDVINGNKHVTVNTTEKDYENRCVKLGIFY